MRPTTYDETLVVLDCVQLAYEIEARRNRIVKNVL